MCVYIIGWKNVGISIENKLKVNGIIHQFLRFPTSPISHALNDFTFQIKLQLLSNTLLFNRL